MGRGLLSAVSTTRETSVVALAPGIRVVPGALVDVDGRTFPVDGLGEDVCRMISEPVAIRELIDGLAMAHERRRDEVAVGLTAFLDDLERRELLAHSASFGQEALARISSAPERLGTALATRRPVPAPSTVRRYPANAAGLLRAIVEAHQALAWLGLAFAAGGSGVALALAPDAVIAVLGVRTAALFGGGYLLLVLVTIAVHELGHLGAARIAGATLLCSYARLGAAGVSYVEASPARRLAVTAAGPLAALGLDIAVALVIRFGPDAFWARAAVDQLRLSALVVVIALGVAQLLCLTPLTADGRRLRVSWREWREEVRADA